MKKMLCFATMTIYAIFLILTCSSTTKSNKLQLKTKNIQENFFNTPKNPQSECNSKTKKLKNLKIKN